MGAAAAVAQEAFGLISSAADATGFEEDARLTAIWLWTLKTVDPSPRPSLARGEGEQVGGEVDAEAEGDDEDGGRKSAAGGFVLEFDAARKIAQGLGAHLEDLGNLVEVKGEIARLLPVGERALYLCGKDAGDAPRKKQKREQQLSFLDVNDEDGKPPFIPLSQRGKEGVSHEARKLEETVLDRIHPSMILFAAGHGEALKRFLVEDGVGKDQRFWRLAQALSARYPPATDEKRWVDGILARKKGLGF